MNIRAAADVKESRWGRSARVAGLIVSSIVAAVASVWLLLPLAARGFVRVLDLTLNAAVWLAAALSNGTDRWTILTTVGRAAAGLLLGTRALTVIAGLVVIGAAAIYAL